MTPNVLQFLTAEDLRLFVEKAVGHHFASDELILEEGSRRQAIFMVRKGMVRIERSHLGQGVAYAHLGPGEVFGEMSFLENTGASASVYADDEVDVDVVEGAQANALMMSVPGFATRFYQSLAITLAHRLRKTSMLIPSLMVEEIPQVTKTPAHRVPREVMDLIPRELAGAVKEFRRPLLRTDLNLKHGKISEDKAAEAVCAACDALMDAFRYHLGRLPTAAEAIGTYVFREVFPFFMLGATFDRAYTKPRGYAGDYQTLDMIYSAIPTGEGRLGPFMDRWVLGLPWAEALRNRRQVFAEALKTSTAEGIRSTGRFLVTALSCGPARELLDALAAPNGTVIWPTCVDVDAEALAYVDDETRRLGAVERTSLLHENVLRLALGRTSVSVPPQNMIYSVGIVEYLEDRFVVGLLNWIHDHLVPGGVAILAGLCPSNPDKPFMDHILDWRLIHRTQEQLRDLISESKFASHPITFVPGERGVQLIVFCSR
ncbi:MAG: cyclic nucleotide-binding domain-containing protein [Pseudomonadota bacterium]